ncbi:hypothetical protein DH2020_020757 [Rehmannia glutinosa]|uniref:Uncharacterized protein n=1 Tax=Rehmannia glutinosa TaxID=99300 RepID=A0ABR0W716_REHGL
MPGFTCKRALHRANCFGLNYYFHLPKIHFLGLNLFSSAPRDAVKPSSKNANEDSFAVNYLIDVHGFSRASALKASQKTPYSSSVHKGETYAKIEFFKSLGFSSSEIPRVLAAGDVLLASLKTKTIPSYNFLKNLFASDKDLLRCVKGYPLILASPRTLAANIQTLRHVGLPDSNIAYMVRHNPRAMLVSCHKFSEAVTEAENVGFNPLRISFVKGIWALNNCKSTWKEKMEEYKRWGMSEDEVLATFRKYPWFMITSADKIRRVFELLVNEMGQTYSIVMKRPPIVSLSIEKRIFPRCTVYQFLLSKDLVKPNGLGQMLVCTEEMFLKKYVKIYKEEAPEILKLYHERLGLSKRVDCKND